MSALCATFQWPAYSAALTLLVPKRNLGRANGMVQTSQGLAQLLSPVLAGLLVVTLGVSWVIFFPFKRGDVFMGLCPENEIEDFEKLSREAAGESCGTAPVKFFDPKNVKKYTQKINRECVRLKLKYAV